MVQIVSLLSVFAVMAMSFAQQMGAPEQMGGAPLVRQCSCEELEQCRKDIKMEGLSCSDSCWQIANQITQRPEELRQCFEGKTGQVGSFVNCFQDSYRGYSVLSD
jgi:hypothetical protein